MVTRLGITPMPYSLEFNGTSQTAISATNIGISGSNAVSMGGWVKFLTDSPVDENTPAGVFLATNIDNAGGPHQGPFLLYQTRTTQNLINQLQFGFLTMSGLYPDTSGQPGAWHHYVFTSAGGTNGAVKLYIDGVLHSSPATDTGEMSDGPWQFGGIYLAAFPGFFYTKGRFGPNFVYTRELTQAEITLIYSLQVYPSSGLWDRFMMTEGSGATVTGVNGHVVNLSNSPSWVSTDRPVLPRSAV